MAERRIFVYKSSTVMPRLRASAAAACGKRDVSVIPGATLTSSTQGTPSPSRTMSVRDKCRKPRILCTLSAVDLTVDVSSSVRRAGTKYSERPAL